MQTHPVFGPLVENTTRRVTTWSGFCRIPEFANYRVARFDFGPTHNQESKLRDYLSSPRTIELAPYHKPQTQPVPGSVEDRRQKKLEETLETLRNIGFEPIGAYQYVGRNTGPRGTSDLRAQAELLRRHAMVHPADQIYATVETFQRDLSTRAARADIIMHRVFQDGRRLTVANTWGDCPMAFANAMTEDDPQLPRNLDDVTPAGVVRLTYIREEDPKALHAQIIQHSQGRTPIPATPDRFVTFYQDAYARDVVDSIAIARAQLAQAQAKLGGLETDDQATLMEKFFSNDKETRENAERSLRMRGIFPTHICPHRSSKTPDAPSLAAAWNRFLTRQPYICDQIKAKALDAALRFVNEEKLVRILDDVNAETLPQIMELQLVSILAADSDQKAQVVLHFQVLWDMEHGFHVRVDTPEIQLDD